MAQRGTTRRNWVKIYVTGWLHGSIRWQMSPEQRSVWADLIALAGECNKGGRICDNDGRPFPSDYIANQLNIPLELLNETVKMSKDEGRINKKDGVICEDCSHYDPIAEKILIIKLGAAGDVIRTTPLLRKLKQVYPKSIITWLTHSPELVPKDWVEHIWPFDLKHILTLQSSRFDLLINLDKDLEACALASQISAKEKKGFHLSEHNKCHPINIESQQKFLTGIFDGLNKKNKRSPND